MKLEIGKTYKTRLSKTRYYIFALLKSENRFLGLNETGDEICDWDANGLFDAKRGKLSTDLTEESDAHPINPENLIQTLKEIQS